MADDPLKVDKPGEKINFSAGQRLSDTKNAASKWGIRPASTSIRQSKKEVSNIRDHKKELEAIKESSYKRKSRELKEEQSKEEEKRLQFYKVKFFKK